MIGSDAAKQASRKANRSLRPKTNWLWKSLSRPAVTECALAGLSRAGYGSGPDFLFALEDAGHTFLVDVHKSFVVYELDPQPTIPVLSSKGFKARRSIAAKKALSVEALVESCSAKGWRICGVRDPTRGSLKLRVLRKA